MNILTGECKVKKILDANSDVLGDLTGVKATSTTPFSFQGSKRIIGKNLFDKENANITNLSNKLELVDYSITGASGGVGDNRNLFDKNNPDLVNLYPNLDTGTVMDGSGYDAYSLIIPITSGSYIFQIYQVEGTLVCNRCCCACYSTYPQVGTTALSVDDTASRRGDIVYNSFYAPEGTQYLMVFLWSGSDYSISRINSVIANNNIMVGRGTGLTLNEYAAYEESYDIPIIISGKNEIINTVSSQTYNGLTIIRNNDGSITVNGTASANTNFIITRDSHTFEVADYQEIEKEKYILSGSPLDGGVNKYLLSFRYTPSIGTTSSLARVPAGGSVIIDNTNGDYNTIAPYLSVWSGVACNNVTFKPMLRKINTTDTYEPPFKQKVILSLDAPLGAGDTITLDDTNIDIPINNGLNTISFQTSVQPSEVTLSLNESGEKHANKIMDASNHTLVDLFPFEHMHKVSYYSQDGSTLISKEYVPHGGNAIGSVVISKDSTAQYNFTFAGWSALTGQTSSTPNILENITADRNVYAAFSETVRTYTVYFYNYDNTLLQTVQNVPYGGSATYTESTPTKTDYTFTGWLPEPTNISGDTSCYAQFEPVVKEITDSWATISARSAAGTAQNYYSVGDCKAVELNGTMGTLALDTTLYVYILGFDHNSVLEGTGVTFGGFKTGYTTSDKNVGLCDTNINQNSNDGSKWFSISHYGNNNYGGWMGCDLRYDILGSTDTAPSGYGSAPTTSRVGYNASSTCATNPVANTLMSCLPSSLRAVMKPITKYTDNTGNKSNAQANVTASIDYLPLLSEYEVHGARTHANQYEQNNQLQYAYYSAGNAKAKYQYNDTSSSVAWWLRSPEAATANGFCNVYGIHGNAYTYTTYSSRGVAPIFLV